MMQQYLTYNREKRVYGTPPARSACGYHHIHGAEEAWDANADPLARRRGRAEKPKRGMPKDDQILAS
jgi:hypothetical protein